MRRFFGQNRIFRPESRYVLHNFGTQFLLGGGGLFSFYHQKLASKAPKTCDFEYFTGQWGGSSPPAPPGYDTGRAVVETDSSETKTETWNFFRDQDRDPISVSNLALRPRPAKFETKTETTIIGLETETGLEIYSPGILCIKSGEVAVNRYWKMV